MNNIGFLFDLDGVLIDSESEYTRIWEEIERHFPTGVKDFASVIKGMTLDKILNDYFPEPANRPEVERLLYKMEKEMTYRFCPGVEDFLHEMREAEIPAAVVTSSNGDKMAHLYQDIPYFRDLFPIIIDSSKVSRSKPDPEGYLLAAQTIGVRPQNCIVFEDSVQGVMAGNRAGAFVVGVCGTKKAEELSPHSHLLIYSFEEITPDIIKKKKEKRNE